MNQEPHVQSILERLKRGQVALFVGPDLSPDVTGLPSRADLARDLARRRDLDESLSLAQVAQRVSRGGNRHDFTSFIMDALSGHAPGAFHRRVVEFVQTHNISKLITTAYDDLLWRAFRDADARVHRVVRGSDVSFIAPDRPTLIQLYGDAQQPDTLVVTEDDHYGLLRAKEDLLDEVRAVLRKNVILFLGYDLGDPDFNLLWREALDRAGRFAQGAYAVWPGLPEAERQVWQDRGIVVLETTPLTFLDDILTTSTSQSSERPTASELRRFLEQDFPRLENALRDVWVSESGSSPLLKPSATTSWNSITSRVPDIPKDIRVVLEKVIKARQSAMGGTAKLTKEQLSFAKQGINQILEFLHERFPAAGVELPSSSARAAIPKEYGKPQPALPVETDMPAWDTDAIRQLLTQAFDDAGLTALCFDHFYPVYDQKFGDEMGKGAKVQHLLDYCKRQDQIEKLLKLVQERNPDQYARFAPRLRREPPPKDEGKTSDYKPLRLADILIIYPEKDGLPHRRGKGQWFSRLRVESKKQVNGCLGKIYDIRQLNGPNDQVGEHLLQFVASRLSWAKEDTGIFAPISIQPSDTKYLDLAWHAHGSPPFGENEMRVASALVEGERNSQYWDKQQDFIPLEPDYYLFVVQIWAEGYDAPVERTYRLHWQPGPEGPEHEHHIRLKEVSAEQMSKGDGESPGPELPFGTGNRWAVLVGANAYEDKAHYGQLQVCVKDVEAIREQLIAGGFDSERVRLLTDHTPELPSRANILAALKAVADATEPNDLLLFYYSGHGDEAGGESYLIARDGRRVVLDDTAVRVSRVQKIIKQAPARAKVIILDACHSGADIGGKGPKPMPKDFIRRVFEQAEGLAVLASCKQGQLSYEWHENERSVFTHFLLQAFGGAADRDEKGFVTVQDASRHVTDGVKLWASQRNRIQTPTLQYTVAGDIILVRYP